MERIKENIASLKLPQVPLACPFHSSPDYWVWNPLAAGSKVILLDESTAIFHPVFSNSTQAILGTVSLNGGIRYWEIVFAQRVFGTAMMVGIGSSNARLESKSFDPLIGEDANSWGLSHKGYIHHNGISYKYCEPFAEHVPTVVGILFDGVNGTLTFFKDGVNLGIAFRGIVEPNQSLYPMICSTAAKTIMRVQNQRRCNLTLQDLCRDSILKHLSEPGDVLKLKISPRLRQYVFQHSWKIPVPKKHRP